MLRGKDVFWEGQRQPLLDRLEAFDFSVGVGSKLRTLLTRGIGIHHAGLLPRYRHIVETLFEEKLLPICVCTETLAAGLNLPARSVILTTLVKGPRDKKKLIEAGSAQQMFGRAGRPQFDTKGFVFALAHEDDVKIARWQEKYDSIPEDSKDPKIMAAKKALGKKKPTRRQGFTYWNADQFTKLQTVPPAKLASKGNLNWRWLAYLLDVSAEIEPIRQVMRRRLMDSASVEGELKRLTRMLVTLHELGMVMLNPPPPESWRQAIQPTGLIPLTDAVTSHANDSESDDALTPQNTSTQDSTDSTAIPTSNQNNIYTLLDKLKLGNAAPDAATGGMALNRKGQPIATNTAAPKGPAKTEQPQPEPYDPLTATPTEKLKEMMVFRAVHPLYGTFLMDYLGLADRHEMVQSLESLLEMPGSVAKSVRVPWPDELPPGQLSLEVVDPAIIKSGLAALDDLYPSGDQSHLPPELRKYPVPLAQKMRMLFESKIDHAGGLFITPVWAIGDLINLGGDFDKFIRLRELVKQEGILFKHLLRMILLCGEFAQLTPRGITPEAWKNNLKELSDVLTTACRAVDPQCTDETLEELAEGA